MKILVRSAVSNQNSKLISGVRYIFLSLQCVVWLIPLWPFNFLVRISQLHLWLIMRIYRSWHLCLYQLIQLSTDTGTICRLGAWGCCLTAAEDWWLGCLMVWVDYLTSKFVGYYWLLLRGWGNLTMLYDFNMVLHHEHSQWMHRRPIVGDACGQGQRLWPTVLVLGHLDRPWAAEQFAVQQ